EPEGKDLGDAHAGEEFGGVVEDDLVELDVAPGVVAGGGRGPAAADDRLDADVLGQHVGDLDACEAEFGVAGLFEQDAEVLGEVGDDGDAVARVDRQRGEDGEELLAVPAVDGGAVVLGQVRVGGDDDALGGEGGDEFVGPAPGQ